MNPLHEELHDELLELGRRPAPPPRPAFVSDLEHRLREQASTLPPRQPAAPWMRPLLVAAAAALLIVLAVVPSTRDDRSGPVAAQALRLASTTGEVTVVRPDGAATRGRPGLVLGEGDQVRTGSDGQARAGAVVLGPNEAAVVRNGALRRVFTPPPPRPPVRVPDTAPDPPPVAFEPLPPPPTTRPAPRSPAPAPATTLPPRTKEQTFPAPSPTSTPTTQAPATTTPTTKPATRTTYGMKLAAKSCRPTAQLHWTAYYGEGFAAYLVLRSTAPEKPSYPPEGTTVAVWRSTDREATFATDEPPHGASVGYMVVAVDAEGKELARSNGLLCSWA